MSWLDKLMGKEKDPVDETLTEAVKSEQIHYEHTRRRADAVLRDFRRADDVIRGEIQRGTYGS